MEHSFGQSILVISDGDERDISTGSFNVTVETGGTAVVRGGNIAGLDVQAGADVTLIGDHFWVNETPLELEPGGVVSVAIRAGDSQGFGDVVSGRLADGRAFSFEKGLNAFNDPKFGDTTIRFQRTTEPITVPESVTLPGATQVTAGQTLRLDADRDRFVPMEPRQISAYQGSRVEISGDPKKWTPSFNAYNASFHMTSGNSAPGNLYLGSEFYVSGGTMNGINNVYEGSRVIVTGGSHPDVIWSTDGGPYVRPDGGEVVIVGTEFSSLHSLSSVDSALNRLEQPGDSVVIDGRERIPDGKGGTLPLTIEAALMDGEPLAWELSRSYVGGLLGKETIFADRLTARFTLGFPEGYCDFDSSGACNDADISLLQSRFGSGDRHFDLNYDGAINELDLQILQENVGLGLVPPTNHLVGDIDMNGAVEFADFLILSASFGEQVSVGTGGDLDNDGVVAFVDFLLLSNNYQTSVDAISPVPEPSAINLAFLGSLALLLFRASKLRRN